MKTDLPINVFCPGNNLFLNYFQRCISLLQNRLYLVLCRIFSLAKFINAINRLKDSIINNFFLNSSFYSYNLQHFEVKREI